jgi:hypothetical protein
MSRIAREQATAEKALVASERQRVIYERKVAQLEVIFAPYPRPLLSSTRVLRAGWICLAFFWAQLLPA